MTSKVEKVWDYKGQAKWYGFRPNYSDKAIDILVDYVTLQTERQRDREFHVVDVGAGTGNLTKMLFARGLQVEAVEPNDEMRKIGIETMKGTGVAWIQATGTETTLNSGRYDWVTFGSSFNVIDRELGLKESYRLLKPKGFFTCMWNHRVLNCSIQAKAESIILKHVPCYERGTRREDQRPFLEQYTSLFKDIFYLEVDFYVTRTIDEYINAWRSVKNKYWDVETNEGRNLFNKISDEMRDTLPEKFNIVYTTRAWTVQKVE
ncbi:MAG: class I SAM-dependent methyltransferase [Prevotella sp.]|nr:class I SAM-dependent methyltransferase [Prevotella sp.]